MTLNEIQDYVEGRIQIDDSVAHVQLSAPRDRPAHGTASGAVRSTFELDPMHIIHK